MSSNFKHVMKVGKIVRAWDADLNTKLEGCGFSSPPRHEVTIKDMINFQEYMERIGATDYVE